jgi:hypothetical protein
MRDGSHAIHQVTDAVPAHVGVLVGAHIALRRERHGDELVSVVIINGSEVSELNGGQS